MTGTIDVSQDVPGCVGGIRERPPVDIEGGIQGGGGDGRGNARRGAARGR